MKYINLLKNAADRSSVWLYSYINLTFHLNIFKLKYGRERWSVRFSGSCHHSVIIIKRYSIIIWHQAGYVFNGRRDNPVQNWIFRQEGEQVYQYSYNERDSPAQQNGAVQCNGRWDYDRYEREERIIVVKNQTIWINIMQVSKAQLLLWSWSTYLVLSLHAYDLNNYTPQLCCGWVGCRNI